MKIKKLSVVGLSAMALLAFGAGTAPATTLEINGVPQNKATTLTTSLAPGTSMSLTRTDGTLASTCTVSRWQTTTTSPFTAEQLTADFELAQYEVCTSTPITVHKAGQILITNEAGTTNGTVFSKNTELTLTTPFGTINCKTGTGTQIGTLTGVSSGHATLHLNAVLNCGFLMPSARWKGTYVMTSPTGLGVVA